MTHGQLVQTPATAQSMISENIHGGCITNVETQRAQNPKLLKCQSATKTKERKSETSVKHRKLKGNMFFHHQLLRAITFTVLGERFGKNNHFFIK